MKKEDSSLAHFSIQEELHKQLLEAYKQRLSQRHKPLRSVKQKAELVVSELHLLGQPIPRNLSVLAAKSEQDPVPLGLEFLSDNIDMMSPFVRDKAVRAIARPQYVTAQGMIIPDNPLESIPGYDYIDTDLDDDPSLNLQQKIQKKVKEQMTKFIIDEAMQNDLKVPDKHIVEHATSPECKGAFVEYKELKQHFKYLVDDTMDGIDSACSTAIETIEYIEEWQGQAEELETLSKIIRVLVGLMAKLPTNFKTAFKTIAEKIEKGPEKLFKWIKEKFEKFMEAYGDEIKEGATDLQRQNFVVAIKVQAGRYLVNNVIVGPVLKVDSVCPEHVGPHLCGDPVKDKLNATNGMLRVVVKHVKAVKELIVVPVDWLKEIKEKIQQKFVQEFFKAMKSLQDFLQPFIDALNDEICFPVPDAEMICENEDIPGTSWSKEVCRPKFGAKHYCFVIKEIMEKGAAALDSLGGLADELMDKAEKLIKEVLDKLSESQAILIQPWHACVSSPPNQPARKRVLLLPPDPFLPALGAIETAPSALCCVQIFPTPRIGSIHCSAISSTQ